MLTYVVDGISRRAVGSDVTIDAIVSQSPSLLAEA